MGGKQQAFKFLKKHEKQIKNFGGDRELLQEYGRLLMKLALRVDELENHIADIGKKGR